MGFWLTVVAGVAALMIVGALVARNMMAGKPLTGNLFAAKPERRLSVVEYASVDSRRRLILIKRDNVEHLIMTGGPVDVVIENGIGASQRPRGSLVGVDTTETGAAGQQPVFSRPARQLGQAVNE